MGGNTIELQAPFSQEADRCFRRRLPASSRSSSGGSVAPLPPKSKGRQGVKNHCSCKELGIGCTCQAHRLKRAMSDTSNLTKPKKAPFRAWSGARGNVIRRRLITRLLRDQRAQA